MSNNEFLDYEISDDESSNDQSSNDESSKSETDGDESFDDEPSDDKISADKISVNIRTNDSGFRHPGLSKMNDTQVVELRNLLKGSDGACIERFLDKAQLIEASLNEQKRSLNSHVCLQWNRSWENIIFHCLRDAVKTMKVPSTEAKAYKQISLTLAGKIKNNGKEISPSELLFSAHISYGKGKYLNQTVFFLQNLPRIIVYVI